MTLQCTIGFLGFGNMGSAIAGGLLETGTIGAKHLIAYDVDEGRRASALQLGIGVAESPVELCEQSDVIILAVKPQVMDEALERAKPGIKPATLVVSIAAGISIGFLTKRLGDGFRIARVMPNTPALVNAGAAGIALSANCTPEDAAVVKAIFESIGVVETVTEDKIDAVTALSGSGPAYFFYMVECLVDAACRHGLAKEQATRLAAQTLVGAGLLLRQSGEPAQVLRERVTSKGGTTEAALKRFQADGFCDTVAAGVEAAVRRSRELGQ